MQWRKGAEYLGEKALMRDRRALELLDPEFFDEGVVRFLVLLLEILEVRPAVGDHLEETATRVIVLLVLLQMCGKLVDLLAQDRYLHFRRTGVTVVALVLRDDYLFFLDC